MKTQRSVVIGIVLIMSVIVVFQFFLRYTYIHADRNQIVRIDRLNNNSCVMPCLPTPDPTPTPTQTPFNKESARQAVGEFLGEQNLQAIELVKGSPETPQKISALATRDYEWTTRYDATNMGYELIKSDKYDPNLVQVFEKETKRRVLVCYCTNAGGGQYWQADLAKRQIHYVNDNADLSRQYGLAAIKH